MTRGDVEYRTLQEALANTDAPPCSGDPRFILEPHQITPAELDHLADTICRPCHLRALCRDYGNAARPPAAIWAGKTYKPTTRRTMKGTTP